jgi:hypothetical protein
MTRSGDDAESILAEVEDIMLTEERQSVYERLDYFKYRLQEAIKAVREAEDEMTYLMKDLGMHDVLTVYKRCENA